MYKLQNDYYKKNLKKIKKPQKKGFAKKTINFNFGPKSLKFPVWHDAKTRIVVIEFDALDALALPADQDKKLENLIEQMIYSSLGYETIERLKKLEKELAFLAAS